jgi:hypothetical protein
MRLAYLIVEFIITIAQKISSNVCFLQIFLISMQKYESSSIITE